MRRVVDIIYTLDKAFSENETRQTEENFDLSYLVPEQESNLYFFAIPT